MGSRLETKLLRLVGKASKDFDLIVPGDRIMVGVSGGKDSYTLLYLLRQIQRRVPFEFSVVGVNLDQGHPGFPADRLRGWFETEGYDYRMIARDTYAIVQEKVPEGKTYCSMCSRLRRGILYSVAEELGATKIALGHHRDDIIETLMLNLLYSGQIKAMPPRLVSDDKRNIVIRPLVYCVEDDIRQFSEEMDFPIIPCDLCGTQENLERQNIKRLISHLNDRNSNVKGNLFAALSNVRPSHLLDPDLRSA
jgi:tRNA 2-thiocytidine biosynthesis protein TtcA